ncbi:Flp family type IVb pilin [Castellaniella sp. MT123]|uniref:Flp family type IVb pilin n=1 Tax=Castellaniella sp. MT123 TaxID=3140381 RepID=UPI0031F4520B
MYTQLCTKLWVAMDGLKRDERGVAAIEYSILAALIIIALATAIGTDFFTPFFTHIQDLFNAKAPV